MTTITTSIRFTRCSKAVIWSKWRRSYSATSKIEKVTIPVQSNGNITLDIHHPPNEFRDSNSHNSVLLYLPRSPLAQNSSRDATNISVLRSNLRWPICQINYRLSSEHRYPTPVHDMLCGFDWIVDNLLPKRGISRVGRSDSVGQLAVCGEHIGGSLGTALALTECRAGEPRVVAAAVSNPVVDWIPLGSDSNVSKRGISKDTSSSELTELLRLRSQLFTKPEHYFDPFASPILFFRSAGAEVPPAPPDIPVDDLEQLSLAEREEAHRNHGETAFGKENIRFVADENASPVLRKASRRFPSKALNLRLPQFHISTSTTSPLHEQAHELSHVLRQSFVRQSKYATQGLSDFGRKVLLDDEVDELDSEQQAQADRELAEAKENVELHTYDEPNEWDGSPQARERLSQVAKWLQQKLG